MEAGAQKAAEEAAAASWEDAVAWDHGRAKSKFHRPTTSRQSRR